MQSKEAKLEIVQHSRSHWCDADLDTISKIVWPEAWHHNKAADELWMKMWRKYPDFRFVCSSGGNLIATFTTAPVIWTENDFSKLPDSGWEWVLESSVQDTKDTSVVSAIAMNILPEYRGQNLSTKILQAAKEILLSIGIKHLIAPVRPSFKYKYPLIPMEQYISWQNASGKMYDPWIRVHTNIGAKVIKTCERSMVIRGTAQEWFEWTGVEVVGPGDYIIPFALNPVRFSKGASSSLEGVYVEPNVWVVHTL